MYRPHISPKVRTFSLTLVVVLIGASAWRLRTRQILAVHEAAARASREAKYVLAAAALQQVIVPGMTRSEVESILNARSMRFELRSGAGTHDEIVPLGHESSSVWACNWEQVQLLITFAPAGPQAPSSPDTTGFSQASPDDPVKHVALDHWQRDCM